MGWEMGLVPPLQDPLSTMPLSSVPKVAVVETFDCTFLSRPRHPRIFIYTFLMSRVCFKPISVFQMYQVIGLIQTGTIKNVTLKAAKRFVGFMV